jgi:hypothetical protein
MLCVFAGESSFGDGDTKGQYENMQITSVLQPYPGEKDLDNLNSLGSQHQNTGKQNIKPSYQCFFMTVKKM